MMPSSGGEIVLLIGGLAVLGYLAIRLPTVLLLAVLGSFAISPEALFGPGSSPVGLSVVHKVLLIVALAANALKFGVRRIVPWPVVCLAVIVLYNLAFSDLHRHLSFAMMVTTALTLAVPWLFPNVALEPGSRRAYALVLSTTSATALVAALALTLNGNASLMEDTYARFERLSATGNANELSVLALAGCLVAAHELLRRREVIFGALIFGNGVVLLLAGSRGAFVAGAVFAALYLARSRRARAALRTYRTYVTLGLLGLAPLLVYAMTGAVERSLLEQGDAAQNFTRFTTGRDRIWTFYVEEFRFAPLLGRGIGISKAAPIGFLEDERIWSPHNEYLHVVVSGGIVGLALFLAAVGAWFLQLIRTVDDDDRIYVGAAAGSLAVFAMVENVLLLPAMYPFFAYLCVLKIKPIRNRRRVKQEPRSITAPIAVATAGGLFARSGAAASEPGSDGGRLREADEGPLRSRPPRHRDHEARPSGDGSSSVTGRRK